MFYPMKGILMLFLSLGIGYVVVAEASREKGSMKTLGYLLGIIIIAGSLLLTAAKVCPLSRCKLLKEKFACGSSGPKQIVGPAGVMKPPTK